MGFLWFYSNPSFFKHLPATTIATLSAFYIGLIYENEKCEYFSLSFGFMELLNKHKFNVIIQRQELFIFFF